MTEPKRAGRIPLLNLAPEIEELWEELSAAALRVLRSGRFVLGPEVEAFEREAAAYLGARHAAGLNSGTDALVIGLRALGVGPGDEVITAPFTFFATAEAISLVGATPVFVDIEEASLNLDPERVAEAVTERTKAIVPVHLFGRPAELGAILEIARANDLAVLEDCAQAFGAETDGRRVGTLGNAGAFSFYPTKNLGGLGDGGLLVTDEDAVADAARRLRVHGEAPGQGHVALGYNARLDEIQAALLRVKLPHVDRWNEARREAARRYGELLAGVPGVVTPEVVEGHVFHLYTIRVTDGRRDAVRERLQLEGIASGVYYGIPVHRSPVYGWAAGSFPAAERAATEVLSLPLWAGIQEWTQETVADVFRGAL